MMFLDKFFFGCACQVLNQLTARIAEARAKIQKIGKLLLGASIECCKIYTGILM